MTEEMWHIVRAGAQFALRRQMTVLPILLPFGKMEYVVIRQEGHTSIYCMAILEHPEVERPTWATREILLSISWHWTTYSKSERCWQDNLTPPTAAQICAMIERLLAQ